MIFAWLVHSQFIISIDLTSNSVAMFPLRECQWECGTRANPREIQLELYISRVLQSINIKGYSSFVYKTYITRTGRFSSHLKILWILISSFASNADFDSVVSLRFIFVRKRVRIPSFRRQQFSTNGLSPLRTATFIAPIGKSADTGKIVQRTKTWLARLDRGEARCLSRYITTRRRRASPPDCRTRIFPCEECDS